MAKKLDIFVSVVLIGDSISSGLSIKTEKAIKMLKREYTNFEILVVDNGISDDERKSLVELLPKLPCIRIIRLAKNTDIDTAIFSGIESSIGDYICVLYNNDPIDKVIDFIKININTDIVFGVAENYRRSNYIEALGEKVFYWYNRKYLELNIEKGSTYFISMNRSVANALTRSNRSIRHFRHLIKEVGFDSEHYKYTLESNEPYSVNKGKKLVFRAIDMVSSYSSHPLRIVSYLGIVVGSLNVVYAIYVVIVNLTRTDIEKGWTTLSLQSSIMFFFLFIILAIISEYIGKILVESRGDSQYNIKQELSSTISFADETRKNVTK
jgi:polyisoprenyl-phosphate glycosyltransferase